MRKTIPFLSILVLALSPFSVSADKYLPVLPTKPIKKVKPKPIHIKIKTPLKQKVIKKLKTKKITKIFQPKDILKLKRIYGIDISPNGKYLAFSVYSYNEKKKKMENNIWICCIDKSKCKKFTNGKSDGSPSFSSDSSKIVFVSRRYGKKGVYVIPINGGEAKLVVDISNKPEIISVRSPKFSADGTWIVFLGLTDLDVKTQKDKKAKKEKMYRVFEKLGYRHWNRYIDNQYWHLYAYNLVSKKLIRLTYGSFSVVQFTISPDSKRVMFIANTNKTYKIDIDTDIFEVPIEGGKMVKIWDDKVPNYYPLYIDHGKKVAFLATQRPGYESDYYKIMVGDYKDGKIVNAKMYLKDFDNEVVGLLSSEKNRTLYFLALVKATKRIYSISYDGGKVKEVSHNYSYVRSIKIDKNGKYIAAVHKSLTQPEEVAVLDIASGKFKVLSNVNKYLRQFMVIKPKEIWVPSGKYKIHALVLEPLNKKPGKKYPLILEVHGGPQGMFGWGQGYSLYDPMFEFLANHGYYVVLPNPAGSMGYGQAFTDLVRGNWGGTPYKNLMDVVDYVIKHFDVDPKRLGVTGISYGGYMTGWIITQTNRFKAAVADSGVYNQLSEYGTTDEQFFPDWEFYGPPYFKEYRKLYEKWSPINYITNAKTPTLVVAGRIDYRVPYSQAQELFTALQTLRVPSKMLFFLNEGHGLHDPKNQEAYLEILLKWFDKYLKK